MLLRMRFATKTSGINRTLSDTDVSPQGLIQGGGGVDWVSSYPPMSMRTIKHSQGNCAKQKTVRQCTLLSVWKYVWNIGIL